MDSSSAKILDGKTLAKKIHSELRSRIESRPENTRPPGLAVLMVGDNPASEAYVRNKEKACAKVGIASFGRHFPENTSLAELQEEIAQLNEDDRVDGILLQLPVPDGLDSVALLNTIAPDKDVDGLHPTNMGRLMRGELGLRSCTPAGVMRMLEEYDIDPKGKTAVVIGRSILVGKPIAMMLLEANATVTIAHSKTADLGAIARSADILVVAIGRPGFITDEMIKPGAVVIDVGINRVTKASGKSGLTGDVNFESAKEIAKLITPVPGGVGPMTVAMLLQNTVTSYTQRMGLDI